MIGFCYYGRLIDVSVVILENEGLWFDDILFEFFDVIGEYC